MGTAQFIGAQIGARIAMKTGSQFIKPLLVTVFALCGQSNFCPIRPIRCVKCQAFNVSRMMPPPISKTPSQLTTESFSPRKAR